MTARRARAESGHGVERREQPAAEAVEQRGIRAQDEIEQMIVDQDRLRMPPVTGHLDQRQRLGRGQRLAYFPRLHERSDHRGDALQPLAQLREPEVGRAGHECHDILIARPDQRVSRQRGLGCLRREDHRGQMLRHRPAREHRELAQRLLVDAGDEQAGQLRPAPVALPRPGGLLLRIAAHAERGKPVDIGEEQLGELHQDGRRRARLDSEIADRAPRNPGADPVGRKERVEPATLAQLTASELEVEVARQGGLAGLFQQIDESGQRTLDAHRQVAPEKPLDRSRVLGDLLAHRGVDVGREGRQHLA